LTGTGVDPTATTTTTTDSTTTTESSTTTSTDATTTTTDVTTTTDAAATPTSASSIDTSTTTATTSTTTTTEPPTWPLTGAGVPEQPALVVKVDNVDAEPQAGLNQADIVFEEIVEGRATRFAAVFNSQEANPVGPIRSGRTQDVDLLLSL